MKKYVLLLVGIVIGAFIGLSIPYRLFIDEGLAPLLPCCSHGFWDWTLRVLQVVGTFLAVIVALFKEDWVARRFKPNLQIDKENCCLYDKVVAGKTNRYDAKILLSNVGRGKANNLKVVIQRIDYRHSRDRQNSQTVVSEPFALLFDNGSEQFCLPTDDEISIDWLSILQTPTPNSVGGSVPPVPPLMLTIGRDSIQPSNYDGVLDVTFLVKCDELKPQKHVARIEWDGTWCDKKCDMQEVFSYEWINGNISN